MKKQSTKSSSSRSQTPTQGRSKQGAATSVIPEVLLGTTGIAIISAAAVGVLGFVAWKKPRKNS